MEKDFADGTTRYDVIIDVGGNSSLSRLRSALTPKGALVIVGGEEGGRWFGGIGRQLRAVTLSPFVSQRLTFFVAGERGSDMEYLAELFESGRLTPTLDRTYPLDEAADAVRRLEAGEARGKLALVVD